MHVITALGRLLQEDEGYKNSPGYIMELRVAWATLHTVSKEKRRKKEEKEEGKREGGKEGGREEGREERRREGKKGWRNEIGRAHV